MLTVTDLTTLINQLLPEPHAGLLNGILFGTKASLSVDLKEALVTTGTIHITALSGMNITILMNLAASTLLRVFSRKTTSVLTVLIIIGFILFVGASPSVVRAGVMGSLSLIAVVFGRQRRALQLLATTVLLMIVIHPPYLTELSFQLSSLATLGIILFASKNTINKKELPLVMSIKDDLRTTLAAQIFTTPLIMIQFHRISLIAPLSNVLIGWLIAPLTVYGLILVLVGTIWFPLAVPLSWGLWLLLEYVLQVIYLTAGLPFASIRWD